MTTLENRFWYHVDKSGECWIWTASCGEKGYGQFKVGKTMERAHRVAWELENGPIPDGIDVLHTCDNRKCCNPKHLFLGTDLDNMRDMINKGRDRKALGENASRARLTTIQVTEIKEELKHPYKGIQTALAIRYGVYTSAISNINLGKTWGWL